MKRKLSYILLSIVLFASAFNFAGCTSEKDILGTWVAEPDSYGRIYFYTFNSDYTISKFSYIHGELTESDSSTWEKGKGNIFYTSMGSSGQFAENKLEKDKLIRTGVIKDSTTNTTTSYTMKKIDTNIEDYIEQYKSNL